MHAYTHAYTGALAGHRLHGAPHRGSLAAMEGRLHLSIHSREGVQKVQEQKVRLVCERSPGFWPAVLAARDVDRDVLLIGQYRCRRDWQKWVLTNFALTVFEFLAIPFGLAALAMPTRTGYVLGHAIYQLGLFRTANHCFAFSEPKWKEASEKQLDSSKYDDYQYRSRSTVMA